MLLAVGTFLWGIVDKCIEGTDEGGGEKPLVWIRGERGDVRNFGVFGVFGVLEEKEDREVAANFELLATNSHGPFSNRIALREPADIAG